MPNYEAWDNAYNAWAQSPVEGPLDPGCPFCDIGQGKERSLFDRAQPIGNGKFYLTPTVGMMLPGYFLVATRSHDTSFAQRGEGDLALIDHELTRVTDRLRRCFGSYFRLEHGSDNVTECGSGGCLDHAHTHLAPADEDVGEYMLRQLPWQEIDSYTELREFRGEPYIYLGRSAIQGEQERHYVVSNPNLPGQWVRRQIAAVRGSTTREFYGERIFESTIGEDADWALHPAAENLSLTMVFLRAVPRGRASLRLSGREQDFQPSDDYTRPAGCQPWVNLEAPIT